MQQIQSPNRSRGGSTAGGIACLRAGLTCCRDCPESLQQVAAAVAALTARRCSISTVLQCFSLVCGRWSGKHFLPLWTCMKKRLAVYFMLVCKKLHALCDKPAVVSLAQFPRCPTKHIRPAYRSPSRCTALVQCCLTVSVSRATSNLLILVPPSSPICSADSSRLGGAHITSSIQHVVQ